MRQFSSTYYYSTPVNLPHNGMPSGYTGIIPEDDLILECHLMALLRTFFDLSRDRRIISSDYDHLIMFLRNDHPEVRWHIDKQGVCVERNGAAI